MHLKILNSHQINWKSVIFPSFEFSRQQKSANTNTNSQWCWTWRPPELRQATGYVFHRHSSHTTQVSGRDQLNHSCVTCNFSSCRRLSWDYNLAEGLLHNLKRQWKCVHSSSKQHHCLPTKTLEGSWCDPREDIFSSIVLPFKRNKVDGEPCFHSFFGLHTAFHIFWQMDNCLDRFPVCVFRVRSIHTVKC